MIFVLCRWSLGIEAFGLLKEYILKMHTPWCTMRCLLPSDSILEIKIGKKSRKIEEKMLKFIRKSRTKNIVPQN